MSQAEINILIVFRRVSEALDALSDEELRRLSDPNYTIDIRAIRSRIKDGSASPIDETNFDAVIQELTALATRQHAQELLDLRFPNKKALELIARRLDIPIIKQDKVDALRDKIIEATVGARIRSQAIQGSGI